MKLFCIPASLFACKNAGAELLDFSQLRLEFVPKEIYRARKHIEELLLNVNSIEELSPELFRCTKIRRLDVSENKLKIIPAEVGYLQSLQELNLSKNEIVEIPEEIGDCLNLAFLDISTNIVTGFPKSFVNLSNLSSLNLSNNSLTQLPADIDKLVNLQFLDVAQCELRSLPNSIVRLERLKVLDLCDNYLTELPPAMNGMVSLEMLDLHCNMVTRLPEELLRCRALRSLDLSGNQLSELPANIGDLQQLVELVLCENQLRQLPNSIGQLKRLEVLKASKNCLAELTPSICSCSLLTDLIICENQLNELPASLGNLRRLRFLDLNVNNLHAIPSTIGGCQALSIFSIRHNQLSELPMEIGKLNQLQVLDLVDNNLKYLPYTLTVLYQAKTLSALWLSFSQPPLPKLTTTNEPVMNVKVLTCYLLPQKEAQQQQSLKRPLSKSCVGGARVCFAGDRREEEEEDKVPIGRFERYDTPHPKPFAPKNRHSRNSGDFSALVPPTLGGGGGNNNTSARSEKQELSGLSQADEQHESRPLRSVLKRRPQSVLSQISTSDLLPAILGGGEEGKQQQANKKLIRKNIPLLKQRGGDVGFQWTLVGGADSMPYKGKTGLFISTLVPGGVAEQAGFRVDDHLLAMNGEDMRGLGHQQAIDLIQQGGDQLEFLVEREQQGPSDQLRRSIPDICAAAAEEQYQPPPAAPERHSFMLTRNGSGSCGFSVTGTGRWPEDPYTVRAVNNTAAIDCPLKPGDRIIAVGGANLKFGARLDQVKTLLSGMPGTRVEVVIDRGGQWPPPPPRQNRTAGREMSVCSSAFSELTLSRSLPSLFAAQASAGVGQGQAEVLPSNGHQQQHAGAVNSPLPNQNANTSAPAPPQHQRLFQPRQQPSLVRPCAIAPSAPAPPAAGQQQQPPQPPPRHHRSMSSLIGTESANAIITGNNSNNGITPEMLRASTPIEYPPGEEPAKPPSSALPAKPSRIPQATTSFSSTISPTSPPPLPPKMMNTTVLTTKPSPGIADKNESPKSPPANPAAAISPPLPPRMDFGQMLSTGRMTEPPLATSSPIPDQEASKQQQSPVAAAKLSSHIPVLMSTSVNGGKIPPPVAPKPKLSSNGTNTVADTLTSTCPTAGDMEQPQQQQQSSSTSFSYKLKLFEQLQTTTANGPAGGVKTNGEEVAETGNGSTSTTTIGTYISQKPSGIPKMKPLVSTQDLEKLRESEENTRKRLRLEQQQQQNGGLGGVGNGGEEDDDEHRDTVQELARLLGEQHRNGSAIPSPLLGPMVIRTKKAEMRAERIGSAMDNGGPGSGTSSSLGMADERGDGSVSRASSSLSQRAAEIEKRREWRQARLQSMDVESKRTDDLVKLIASAASAAVTHQQQTSAATSATASNNPSPIPAGP